MVSQKVTIKNPTGLHLRPAGILCKEAMQFKSHVTFRYRENTANAKSVLSVLGACIKSGDEYYYYVKAVPKAIVAGTDKKVTRFSGKEEQDRMTKKRFAEEMEIDEDLLN